MKKLPPLPSIRDIIKLYGLGARKQLSQNFLMDLNVTDKIVKSSGNLKNATVLEIGPGPGSLTRSLLKTDLKKLIAIEKDSRFLPALETLQQVDSRLQFKQADILEIKEAATLGYLSSNRHRQPQTKTTSSTSEKEQQSVEVANQEQTERILLIGNLPFGVATELLLKWLKMIHSRESPFQKSTKIGMTLMFQKEVADVEFENFFFLLLSSSSKFFNL